MHLLNLFKPLQFKRKATEPHTNLIWWNQTFPAIVHTQHGGLMKPNGASHYFDFHERGEHIEQLRSCPLSFHHTDE